MPDTYSNAATELGFTAVAPIDSSVIVCRPEIRVQCTPEKCKNYASNWICPPGCGDLGQCAKIVSEYEKAILLQETHALPEETDLLQMAGLALEHNQRTDKLTKMIRREYPKAFLLTTGGCNLCDTCTYPGKPCRYPQKQRGSLSAFGVNVNELCEKAGLTYCFVKGKVTFVSCILI